MAKGMYTEVGLVARKVKQPYPEVDLVARKAKNGFVEVNNVARQFFTSWERGYVDFFANHLTDNGGILQKYLSQYAMSVTIEKAYVNTVLPVGTMCVFYFPVSAGDTVKLNYTRFLGYGGTYVGNLDFYIGTCAQIPATYDVVPKNIISEYVSSTAKTAVEKTFTVPSGHKYCCIGINVDAYSRGTYYQLDVNSITINGTLMFPI